jgi:hypothetical protein
MKKLILFSLIASITIISCNNKTETNPGLDKYKKNLETAKQFYNAFITNDSTQEASLLADNFKWTGASIGQDSLSKDALLSSDKDFMKAYKETKLTNVEYLPGIDSATLQPDGGVRVYFTVNSKSVTSGKSIKFRYYGVSKYNDAGKMESLEEYYNVADIMKEF